MLNHGSDSDHSATRDDDTTSCDSLVWKRDVVGLAIDRPSLCTQVSRAELPLQRLPQPCPLSLKRFALSRVVEFVGLLLDPALGFGLW